MAYAAGVDVGSTQTKAVIIDEDRQIISRSLVDTGANVVQAAEHAYQVSLEIAADIQISGALGQPNKDVLQTILGCVNIMYKRQGHCE